MAETGTEVDVLILGGGLAGLTLALHLQKHVPAASVTVLERRTETPKAAAHKIGESSVEVFADYLASKLGLRQHLEEKHLPKLGLRFFFPGFEPTSFADRVEMGSNAHPPFRTYQIDRGILEQELESRVHASNATLLKGARAKEVALNEDTAHEVEYELENELHQVKARWVVDCSGRSSFLAKKTGRPLDAPLNHSAAWFRIEAEITPDDWVDTPEWTENNKGMHARRLSTNHIIGEGYWIWLIPLPEGRTSIGICLDPEHRDLSEVNSFEKFLAFTEREQPHLYQALVGHTDRLMDFGAIKRYPKKLDTICSPDRWAIIGDAGSFIDPLYSFGNDFIAMGNSITAELIRIDMEGKTFKLEADVLNSIYIDFIDQTYPLFQGTYKIFQNPMLGQFKIAWDFAVYWTLIASFSVHDHINDLGMYLKSSQYLKEIRTLNDSVVSVFNAWYEQDKTRMRRHFSSIYDFPWIGPINFSLCDPCSEDEFIPQLKENLERCKNLLRDMLGVAEKRGVTIPDVDLLDCTATAESENQLLRRFGEYLT